MIGYYAGESVVGNSTNATTLTANVKRVKVDNKYEQKKKRAIWCRVLPNLFVFVSVQDIKSCYYYDVRVDIIERSAYLGGLQCF